MKKRRSGENVTAQAAHVEQFLSTVSTPVIQQSTEAESVVAYHASFSAALLRLKEDGLLVVAARTVLVGPGKLERAIRMLVSQPGSYM